MASQTITVTVKYSKPGTQPPIYIAGSFSDPAWQPQEMQYTTDENNEHEFHKEVQIEQGKEYQYKFRLGLGDWWTLNEDSPTVTDDIGNKNNLLTVPMVEESSADTKETKPTPQEPQAEEAESAPPLAMEKEKTPSIKETMGTKETDDTLFADEIIKDTDKAESESESKASELEGIIEPHATPAIPETPQMEHVEEVHHIKELQDIGGANSSSSKLGEEDVIEPTPYPMVNIKKLQDLDDIDSKNVSDDGMEDDKAVAPPALVVEEPESKQEEQTTTEVVTNGHDEQNSDHLLAVDAEDNASGDRSRTPELADVAAEVADTAATLDREVPTPPISDEEAGRIGFRRMSSTPIPQVAITAAEVADSAAVIDKEDEETEHKETQEFIRPFDIDDGDLPETPPNEKVPQFSHECGSPPDHEEPCQHEEVDPYEGMRPQTQEEIDLNDPSIKMFPTDKAGILDHLRRMQERLPEDEARLDKLDLAPPSPVVGPNGRPERLHLPAVSPVVLAQRSPSLDSIPEHNDEGVSLLEPTSVKLNGEDKPATNGITVPKEEFETFSAENTPTSKKENEAPLEPERKTRDLVGSVDGSDESSLQAKSEQPPLDTIETGADEAEQSTKDGSTRAEDITEDTETPVPEATKEQAKEDPVKDVETSIPENVEEPAKKDHTEQVEAPVPDTTDEAAEKHLVDEAETHIPDTAKEPAEKDITEQAEAHLTATVEEPVKDDPTELETTEKDIAEAQVEEPTETVERTNSTESLVSKVNVESNEEVPIEEEHVQHASESSLDGICEEGSHVVPAPETPFIVGNNRQLGQDDDAIRELRTDTGPSITIQPATPFPGVQRQLGFPNEQVQESAEDTDKSVDKAASPDISLSPATSAPSTVTDSTANQNDTAKSTAVEDENDEVQVKSRKRQPSPARSLERPITPNTPNSIRSNGKDVKDVNEKSIFKAFFRVVLVEWIGGFFMRLCGGRRRRQVLMAGAVTLITIPALYYFDMVPASLESLLQPALQHLHIPPRHLRENVSQ